MLIHFLDQPYDVATFFTTFLLKLFTHHSTYLEIANSIMQVAEKKVEVNRIMSSARELKSYSVLFRVEKLFHAIIIY